MTRQRSKCSRCSKSPSISRPQRPKLERLAKQYHSGVGVGPKSNAMSLANHCDNFVKNLRAAAKDAREMAQMHRDIAKSVAN